MLSIKLNTKEANYQYEDLKITSDSIGYYSGNSNYIEIVKTNHGFKSGDIVRFNRESLNFNFVEDFRVYKIDDDRFYIASPEDKDYTTIEVFSSVTPFYFSKAYSREEYVLSEDSTDVTYDNLETIIKYYTDSVSQNFIDFEFDEQHIMISDKYYASGYTEDIDENYSSYSTAPVKRCVGDHVVYNYTFFYDTKGLDSNGKYILDASYTNNINNGSGLLNTRSKVYFNLYDEVDGITDVIDETYAGDILYGTNCYIDWENRRVYLTNCVTPSLGNYDDYHRLLWLYDTSNLWDNLIAEYLKQVEQEIILYVADNRFFYEEDGELYLQDDTIAEKIMGVSNLNLGLLNDFDTTIYKDDYIENIFVPEETQRHINRLVDYEKRAFEPYYLENNKFEPAKKIEFNLHFREKTISISDEDGSVYWESNDDAFWNNFGFTSAATVVNYNDLAPSDADLLGKIGFDNDDIYYQKDCLKESFIRLSFYDTNSRRTQKLLFYSTIFLDTGDIYGQFCKNITSVNTEDVEECMNEHTEDKSKRLCTRFECYDRYNMAKCSEGFYIYLFPSIVEGSKPTDIYMKVEFNHAKFGYTVPMTLPIDDDTQNNPVYPDNNTIINPYSGLTVNNNIFPVHYARKTEKGIKTNVPKIEEDMFIKLTLKHDYENNRYIWYLPQPFNETNGNNDEKKIVFNLYEPRVNGLEGMNLY